MHGGLGPLILQACENPTPQEVRGARTGRIRLALVEAGKHTMFVLICQKDMTKGWADMPFSWNLLQPGKHPLAYKQQEGHARLSRYLFKLVLCDQHAIVRAMRAVTVSPQFTQILDAALLRQQANLGEFSPAAHDAELAAAYRRWPTSEAMLSAAAIVETAGVEILAHS